MTEEEMKLDQFLCDELKREVDYSQLRYSGAERAVDFYKVLLSHFSRLQEKAEKNLASLKVTVIDKKREVGDKVYILENNLNFTPLFTVSEKIITINEELYECEMSYKQNIRLIDGSTVSFPVVYRCVVPERHTFDTKDGVKYWEEERYNPEANTYTEQ